MRMIIAFIASLISYFILSLGFVLQKKGIKWSGLSDRILWLAGLLLVQIAPLFNFFSLQRLDASVVTAVSGSNIIFTLFLSRALLGVVLLPADYFYSGLIALSIAGAGLFSVPGGQNSGDFFPWLFQAFPLLLFGLSFLFRTFLAAGKARLAKALVLGLVSGSLAGYMIILMKLLQVRNGLDLLSYFRSPYLYFYLLSGILSFTAVSLAFRKGPIILISPVQYASMVFYPAVASAFVFPSRPRFLQVFFFGVIILSVLLLVKRHAGSGLPRPGREKEKMP